MEELRPTKDQIADALQREHEAGGGDSMMQSQSNLLRLLSAYHAAQQQQQHQQQLPQQQQLQTRNSQHLNAGELVQDGSDTSRLDGFVHQDAGHHGDMGQQHGQGMDDGGMHGHQMHQMRYGGLNGMPSDQGSHHHQQQNRHAFGEDSLYQDTLEMEGGSHHHQNSSSLLMMSQMMMDSAIPNSASLLPIVMSQPQLPELSILGQQPGGQQVSAPLPVAPSSFSGMTGGIAHPSVPRQQEDEQQGEEAKKGKGGRKRRRTKKLDVEVETFVHQKLMKVVAEQYEGSLQRFLAAAVADVPLPDKITKTAGMPTKKTALTKWKRVKLNSLRGSDAHELSLVHRTLAETAEPGFATQSLLETSWEELTIPQLTKMLEETRKMLLAAEKTHACTQPGCERKFSTPGNLRDHMNEHSGDKPYTCTVEGCGETFPTKQLMCRHVKKHQRPFVCKFEDCGKRFAFKERLVVHQKTHSNERPLFCTWPGCGKTFKWANSLAGHMRTHTGEKPFQCTHDGCGRSFGYKVDLTRHLRTHAGQPARIPRET